MEESISPEADAALTAKCEEREATLPHCQCGCTDADPGTVVGWCLWCNHGYVEYSPEIENQHFAHDCSGAPEKMKQASLAGLAKRRAK
jgi:hypothetical protein